jgi:hypothetical protein
VPDSLEAPSRSSPRYFRDLLLLFNKSAPTSFVLPLEDPSPLPSFCSLFLCSRLRLPPKSLNSSSIMRSFDLGDSLSLSKSWSSLEVCDSSSCSLMRSKLFYLDFFLDLMSFTTFATIVVLKWSNISFRLSYDKFIQKEASLLSS